ncbi:MAG: ABC transporter substrate-binding protein, partial [Bacteroidota bacterium]|nr:ABC transporter substrate-binding protein [Bacteroidota bacterium]
ERIQAELMAGKGADIYANTYIDYIKIGKSNHLCNLANWIKADPDFSDNAYYMNIIKSGFDDGNLYSIPLCMMFNGLGSTIEVPELNGKSLNWEEFFELTKGIKRSGVLYDITDYELFVRRFIDRYDSFIDEEHKSNSLDSPDMVKLLEQCKQWSIEGICIPYDTENTEIHDNAFFKEFSGRDMYFLSNFRYDDPSLDFPFYYDIPSDSGKNDKANKISPIDYICINAASQHQGTAWKFVKFLLREDIQATGWFAPVNRKAAESQISQSLNDIKRSFGLDIDTDKVAEENLSILNAIDKAPYLFKNEIEQIVGKEAMRYFKNEISSEDAIKNMAAGVTLYFKEQ